MQKTIQKKKINITILLYWELLTKSENEMNCFKRVHQGTTPDYNIIDQGYNASNIINLNLDKNYKN